MRILKFSSAKWISANPSAKSVKTAKFPNSANWRH